MYNIYVSEWRIYPIHIGGTHLKYVFLSHNAYALIAWHRRIVPFISIEKMCSDLFSMVNRKPVSTHIVGTFLYQFSNISQMPKIVYNSDETYLNLKPSKGKYTRVFISEARLFFATAHLICNRNVVPKQLIVIC